MHMVVCIDLCHLLQQLAYDIPLVLQTIESTREKDETVVLLDDTEVEADEAQDEFAGTRHTFVICLAICYAKLQL